MDRTLIYVGGAVVLGALVLPKLLSSAGVAVPGTSQTSTGGNAYTLPGAPPAPPAYDENYYMTWQYPAMLAANSNIGNSSYILSQSEANQYFQNYQSINEWATQMGSKPEQKGSMLEAARWHWQNAGVQYKCSFLPFFPPKRDTWTPPPANANSSGSGGGNFVSTALSVATTLLAFLGPGDDKLTDADIAILFNAAPIIDEMLPMFYSFGDGALDASAKLEALVKQYAM